MARFEDLNDANIRVMYDDNGQMVGFVNHRGESVGIPVVKKNLLTGGIEISSSGHRSLPRLGERKAIRILDGRLAATHTILNSTVGETFQATFELAAAPDVVWPIYGNGGVSAFSVIGTKVSVIDNDADINNSAGTWVAANTDGSSGGSVPARPGANRPGLLMTAGCAVLANTNRSKIISIRGYIATAGSDIPVTVMGNGADGATDDFTNWTSRTGHRVWLRWNAGDCITTPAGFTSTVNRSFCPIIGVAYLSRGRVFTAMAVGDSTESGRGTYLGSGPVYESLRANGTQGAWEIANLSWSGSGALDSLNTFKDAIAAGLVPDIAVRGIGSPNDVSGTITAANVSNWRSYALQAQKAAASSDIYLVHRSMQPANSSIDSPVGISNWAASDSLRTGLNAEFASSANLFVDYATPVSAVSPNANGQVPFSKGMTTDGIHQNSTGLATQVPFVFPKLPNIF